MFQIKLCNREWVVEAFNDAHNHCLINTPSKVKKFRSQKDKSYLQLPCKSLVTKLSQEGLSCSKISKVMNVLDKDIQVTPAQCSSIMSTHRRHYIGRECYEIIKHLQMKAATSSDFYFTPQFAKDGTLRSIFWADGRSRTSYTQFGDVLVSDVTYQTNKFKFPFAPFVGVNHHSHTILFGAALLEDETEATFTWLFQQFRLCMFDKAPISIVTDQDKGIENAIQTVFPGVRHRHCAWHIKKHFLKRVQPLSLKFKENFNDDYRKWYKSRTIEEFEHRWSALRDIYKLKDDPWWEKIYNLLSLWAKAYLKDTFFAGMTTSGRSESINAFFDGYVNSNTMLNKFVIQYEKAIKSRREAEEDEDFKTRNTKAVLDTNHSIVAMAGERYTRKIFEIFKKDWKSSHDYFHEKNLKEKNFIRYRVGAVEVEKEKWKVVDYFLTEVFKATCSCAKFETWGLLCKHILYIMRKK